MTQLVGIDTGGTFTDFILYRNGEFTTQKILSTPHAPQQAILQGLQDLAEINLDEAEIQLVHGTTVATNTLLQGNGARTAFITNRGFKDLLMIGRQTREQLYSLCPQRSINLFAPDLCFEVDARVSASGRSLVRASNQQVQALIAQLEEQAIDAVAICMLFSFLNDDDERRLANALRGHYFVSYSSELLPEQREYERAVVTWLNSYLGPVTQHYLSDLQQSLVPSHVHVMQSDATTLPAAAARNQAVKLLLSGPAGGVVAASSIGLQTQQTRLLTLDMGGTSTDVALVDGQALITTEGSVSGYPLAMPMLDIHTIGAGGGSIARVDPAHGLHVGPNSAGADPGPACYGRGGKAPTITDANVVLGRLPVVKRWTGGLQLNKSLAETSMQALAGQLNCSVTQAAQGIVALANAHMVQALRVISIQRGYDPRNFCLFPFGGAGTLHMCEIAEQLNMDQILVPINAGILSAYGMLHAPIGQMAARSLCRPWHDLSTAELKQLFAKLQAQATNQLRQVGLQPSRLAHWLDLRYSGQATAISMRWLESNDIAAEFAVAHQQRYGFQLSKYPIELVTVRVWVYRDVDAPQLARLTMGDAAKPVDHVDVVNCSQPVSVFIRSELPCGQKLTGPTIVLDDFGTLFISQAWRAVVDAYGHIHLHRATDGQ